MEKAFKSALAAGVAALSSVSDSASAFDLEKFPLDANPAQVVELLRPKTGSKGSSSESIAVTIYTGAKYVSEARNPNRGTLIPNESIQDAIGKIEKREQKDFSGKELWLTHNHPVKAMMEFWGANGVAKNIFRRPDDALNGPSELDCQDMFTVNRAFWKDKKYFYTNIIVEPGGAWVCGGTIRKISEQDEVLFRNLRKSLLIASQSKTGKSLQVEIEAFEKGASDILGVRILFVRKGSGVDEYNKAKEFVRLPLL